jgi:hypothetical protein
MHGPVICGSVEQIGNGAPLRPLPLPISFGRPALGAANPVVDRRRHVAGRHRPTRLRIMSPTPPETGTGEVRQARAERKAHHRHRQRPRGTHRTVTTRDSTRSAKLSNRSAAGAGGRCAEGRLAVDLWHEQGVESSTSAYLQVSRTPALTRPATRSCDRRPRSGKARNRGG